MTISKYDVAIIGTGIDGSTLAAVLARQGLSVIAFEAGVHPRFVVGESMILETSETMRALAEFYDVPELAYFYASFPRMPAAFRDLLNGKNHLPNNKLRVNLFNRTDGFLGDGSYREHFFHGNTSLNPLIRKAVGEQARYSVPALKRQQRRHARLSWQRPHHYYS